MDITPYKFLNLNGFKFKKGPTEIRTQDRRIRISGANQLHYETI